MSDKMTPIPIHTLLQWALEEYQTKGTIFGIIPHLRCDPEQTAAFLDGALETPIGPAAGPQTQLAQNIVAAYLSGARIFEVKTVQTLDGEDLPVDKPCILARDEGYNVEWSTELTVEQARDEYVKAYVLCKLLSKELGLGGQDGFLFNMSVGYDFEGITSPKIDGYLNTMIDCSGTQVWADCATAVKQHLGKLYQVDGGFWAGLSPCVSRSVTLSTLHGCPPQEIERIAAYLLREKDLHTFVKCNPTLLGYETARQILDDMGYTDVQFGRYHFEHDLQFIDAVPMLERLKAVADDCGLVFGVKLTNTFPVEVSANQLPGTEMYMSGPALYPLSLTVAEKIACTFDGKLPISYSGGADALHLAGILDAGIFPVTVSTTLLKPGGYKRLEQMARVPLPCAKTVDAEKIAALVEAAKSDETLRRPVKQTPVPKRSDKVPLLDCFVAHCSDSCPFGQDIPRYLKQANDGDYAAALRTILEKNPLPNLTGTICSHHCTAGCARNFYEQAVDIRSVKLVAAQRGWEQVLPRLEPTNSRRDVRIAVIGGGPAGMAVSFLLAREGAKVTIFEKEAALGGIPTHVIPSFRIGQAAIERDAQLLAQMGVSLRLGTPAPYAAALFTAGFTHVVIAAGASKTGTLPLEGDAPLGGIEFLRRVKALETFEAKHIVVIGGGNTAMDTARAAKRLGCAPHVTIAYRRTAGEMPADAEELALAQADGVAFATLRAPVSWKDGALTLEVMTLGAPDNSGRRKPEATGRFETLPCDLLLAATGEQIDGDCLANHGVAVEPNGRPVLQSKTLESTAKHVFLAGDITGGGATIAHAIADAHKVAAAILPPKPARQITTGKRGEALSRKGVLRETLPAEVEGSRCLHCNLVCEHCVEVCPNRANVAIPLLSRRQTQVVHVDGMCNECGNCAAFCPYDSAPYREKFTIFSTVADFQSSEQSGFVLADHTENLVRVRLDGMVIDTHLHDQSPLPSSVQELIETICEDYNYLLY